MLDSVHEFLNFEIDKKYKNINQKLKILEWIQTPSHDQHSSFYPRVVNQTIATFTPDVLSLLSKGLKYNLSYKRENWIKILTIEAETAITKLPVVE